MDENKCVVCGGKYGIVWDVEELRGQWSHLACAELSSEQKILEWLGDRDVAVIEIDGQGYAITSTTLIVPTVVNPYVYGFDASPPQWLADYIRQLLKAPF